MLTDKLEAAKFPKAVQVSFDRLVENQLAEMDDFEGKQKELEGAVNPTTLKDPDVPYTTKDSHETSDRLVDNQFASHDEFEGEHKELEEVVSPTMLMGSGCAELDQ